MFFFNTISFSSEDAYMVSCFVFLEQMYKPAKHHNFCSFCQIKIKKDLYHINVLYKTD